ncbi:MAG: alanine racemase, partial [Gammaproteobacteria bacterium]
MTQRIRATIDRSALSHNLAVARQHARGARVLAMIKANAYGHGLVPVAEALQDADAFGVTDVNEAEQLRAGGCEKPIVVLQGL